MDLQINYTKVQGPEEAFKKVKSKVNADMLKRFNIDADVSYHDPDLIVAEGAGFTLNLYFEDAACEVEAKLSVMLRPFKAKILSTLERELKQVI